MNRLGALFISILMLLLGVVLPPSANAEDSGAAQPELSILGEPHVGNTLSLDLENWHSDADDFDVQWFRNGVAMSEATSERFLLTASDYQSEISAQVSALLNGSVLASETTNAVLVELGEFESTPSPTISGLPVVGETLTAIVNEWVPTPDHLLFQWFRSSQPITGANQSSYKVVPEDIGQALAVSITATRVAFQPTERTSVASAEVRAGETLLNTTTVAPRSSVISSTPGWNDLAPELNPVYPRPTPMPSTVVFPGSIVERSEWVSGNGYTIGRPAKPNHIVLHHTAGTSVEAAVNILRGLVQAPTASYVVKDNQLVSMVPEQDSPWTNGRWTSNLYSVTFEMVNDARRGDGSWVSPSARTRETTAWAMARAAQRWQMDLPLVYGLNVFGHRDVSRYATSCPGELDLQAVINRANEILNGNPGMRQFVSAAYYDLLGRSADPEGLSYWASQLSLGMSRNSMSTAFNNSDEYRYNKIREAYNRVLKREPEPDGRAYWYNALVRGWLAPDDMYSTFLKTDEMYLVQGGGTNAGYVSALYREVLSREPEPDGLQYWTSKLDQGQPRSVVADGIWFSVERRNNRVIDAFVRLLGRTAEPEGLQYWSRMASVSGISAVYAGVMGSEEYWNRSQSRFP